MSLGCCECTFCEGRCPNPRGLAVGYGKRCSECSLNCSKRKGSRLRQQTPQTAYYLGGALEHSLGRLQVRDTSRVKLYRG